MAPESLGFHLSVRRGVGQVLKATEVDYDYLMAFTPEAWYVIPVMAIVGKHNIYLHPERDLETGGYERFRNRVRFLE